MLTYIGWQLKHPLPSERKSRFFAAACCHRIWDYLSDERSRRAVVVAESHADGVANDEARKAALKAALKVAGDFNRAFEEPELDARPHAVIAACYPLWFTMFPCHYFARGWERGGADGAAFHAAMAVGQLTPDVPFDEARRSESRHQCDILRDIFGLRPACPRSLQESWLTSTVSTLAQSIYADRAFDRLRILADALEEAGCTDAEVFAHCRGPGPHVRGCWVVDLVLEGSSVAPAFDDRLQTAASRASADKPFDFLENRPQNSAVSHPRRNDLRDPS
jgi:hypothetical protein